LAGAVLGSCQAVKLVLAAGAMVALGAACSSAEGGGCCGGTKPSNACDCNAPVLEANDAALAFGDVGLGTTVTLSLVLTNVGSASTDGPPDLSFIPAQPEFDVPSIPSEIPPGESVRILVTFSPTLVGEVSATLWFPNDVGQPMAVGLTGNGVARCAPVLSTTSISFAPVEVGTPAPSQTVTCTNLGASPCYLSVSALNTDPAFAVTDANGPVLAANLQTLSPDASYAVNVAFDPLDAGVLTSSFTMTLCDSFATCAQPQPIALTGDGT
jgi:hypothetical protein